MSEKEKEKERDVTSFTAVTCAHYRILKLNIKMQIELAGHGG